MYKIALAVAALLFLNACTTCQKKCRAQRYKSEQRELKNQGRDAE